MLGVGVGEELLEPSFETEAVVENEVRVGGVPEVAGGVGSYPWISAPPW